MALIDGVAEMKHFSVAVRGGGRNFFEKLFGPL
jgi:hypothetical protein